MSVTERPSAASPSRLCRKAALLSSLCYMSSFSYSVKCSLLTASLTSASFQNHRWKRRLPSLLSLNTCVSNVSVDFEQPDGRESSILFQQRTQTLRQNSKLSLAPMMDYTDRHFRHLTRLVSDRTVVYSEMVAANAIAHERQHILSSSESLVETWGSWNPSRLLRLLGQGCHHEGPSVLQLGGSDPDQLYVAAKTVYELNQLHKQQQSYHHRFTKKTQSSQSDSVPMQHPVYCDYTAINLNCGCPSPKVAGKGCFGAALMSDPHLVKQLASSMHFGCQGSMPITVKCRIGTDDGFTFTQKDYLQRSEEEEYNSLRTFIETVANGGIVTDFQVHARIAVLGKSFSPAENRKVPPLRYHQVRRLAEEFPELNISLNGGIESLFDVKRELDQCQSLEGVMVGRGWLANPWSFAMADEILYPESNDTSTSRATPKNRMEVLHKYGLHADYEEQIGDPLKTRRYLTKAVSYLFAGEPNSKRFRMALDEIARIPKNIIKDQRTSKRNGCNDLQSMVTTDYLKGEPLISELILEAAATHLSEEVLYRTPKESYDMILWEEDQLEHNQMLLAFNSNSEEASNGKNTMKHAIKEWHQSRKDNENNEMGNMELGLNELN